MKKFILTLLIVALSLFTFVSCTTNNVENNITNNEDSTKNSPNKTDESTKPSNDKTNSKDNESTNTENDSKEILLQSISSNAKDGKVIECDFKAKYNIIDDVIKSWGNDYESNFVESAKGTYYTFKNRNEAFGTNKGGEIFEVRTFNPKLKTLSFKDILNYFGNPDYDILSKSKERIIGYVINDDFKILFVFNNGTDENPYLDHYNILYPNGTKNLMADDPGREW